jgi:hypothetical protein
MAWIEKIEIQRGTGKLQPTQVVAHAKVFMAKTARRFCKSTLVARRLDRTQVSKARLCSSAEKRASSSI